MNLYICQTPDLWEELSSFIQEQASALLEKRDRHPAFHLALSGGSTPLPFFRYLSGPGGDGLPWDSLHLWWADERLVPVDSPDSNVGEALRALSPRSLPPERIHAVPVTLAPVEAAKAYSAELAMLLCSPASPVPVFDCIILGLGPDGHIASLFPGETAFPPERDLLPKGPWAIHAVHGGLSRVSLSPRVLLAARHLACLVTGAGKKEILQRVFSPAAEADFELPATELFARRQNMHWFVDTDAFPEEP